jgi:hypothetical protein
MSERTLIYLFGVPGAGKTSVLRGLFPDRERKQVEIICPHVLLKQRHDHPEDGFPSVIAEIGKDREGGFSGTDALSMSIQPKALALLEMLPYPLVIAEGDRLSNLSFWQGAKAAGWAVWPILLDTPPQEAAEQRAQRGSKQNATWLAGRETKIRNLRPYAEARIVGGNGWAEASRELRDVIRKALHEPMPVAAGLEPELWPNP